MQPFLALVTPVGGGDPGARPGHDLPGGPPQYPSHGLPGYGPVDPGFGVGAPPTDPGYGRPGGGGRPDHGLPPSPGLPTHPIVLPDPPGQTKPPTGIWPPLPPSLRIPGLILVWVIGVGYRWIHAGDEKPDNTLPPEETAEPKSY